MCKKHDSAEVLQELLASANPSRVDPEAGRPLAKRAI
jgi:hypothetical protein